MKVYLVLHEQWREFLGQDTRIIEVCLTKEVAIDVIKQVDVWNVCYQPHMKEWYENDLEDVFDCDEGRREVCIDAHQIDRFYVTEWEVREAP